MAFDLQAGFGAEGGAQALRQMMLDKLLQQQQVHSQGIEDQKMQLLQAENQRRSEQDKATLAERYAALAETAQKNKVAEASTILPKIPINTAVSPQTTQMADQGGAGDQIYTPPTAAETGSGQPFNARLANPGLNLGTDAQQQTATQQAALDTYANAPSTPEPLRGFLRALPGLGKTPGAAEAAGKLLEPQKPPNPGAPVQVGPQGIFTRPEDAIGQPAYHPPKEPKDTSAAEAGRVDRSYQFNSTELEKSGQAVADSQTKLARAADALNERTPQADALVAPQILSFEAGGTGSGLRMNEAEIARIVGGRSVWEGLKAAAQKWSLDPKQALSITDDQRAGFQRLLQAAADRQSQKIDVVTKARDALAASHDVDEHRKIVKDAKNALMKADSATVSSPSTSDQGAVGSPAGLPKVGDTFQGGKVLKIEKIQ